MAVIIIGKLKRLGDMGAIKIIFIYANKNSSIRKSL